MEPLTPLDTLRQLKEMLDAGALTPAEFEDLKQRLVFGAAPVAPLPGGPRGDAAAPPAAPLPLPAPPLFDERTTPPPAGTEPLAAALAAPAAALEAAGLYAAPSVGPVAAEAPAEPPFVGETELVAEAEPPARNPLALVLAIGGVLIFLAVVGYLSFNRRPSERLTSTSQTAADSLVAPIETGPQVAPLPPVAAPETVRVVPARPARPFPAPGARDSATASPAPAVGSAPAPDSTSGR